MELEIARKKFDTFLRKQGLRVTEPRGEVIRLAWSTHDHFSADELHAWSQQGQFPASRATVYRTLTLLVEGGFLAEFDAGQGRKLYEHILGHQHHDHLLCTQCGLIVEFRNDRIESLQEEVAEAHSFVLTSHRLTLEGLCLNCQQAAKNRAEG